MSTRFRMAAVWARCTTNPDFLLPQRPGTDHHLEDAWRRSIIYEVDSSGTVTLRSLGKDGALGGTGANADIVFKFPSRNADGSWIQGDYLTYDSYVPPQQ